MKLKALYLICLISYLLLGCSPAIRLERLTRNHPELIKNTINDTVTLESRDTFILKVEGIDTLMINRDTIIVHDSLSTITIIHAGKDSVRVITKYRPIIFPVEKKSSIITKKQTVLQANHPIDKWKYRKQGIVGTMICLFIITIIFLTIKIYIKQ